MLGRIALGHLLLWITLSSSMAAQTASVDQPRCKVYLRIESAPHALTDWLYTRNGRWRYGVVEPWADGLKRARRSPPTADEVTAAHDKLQQEIAAYRPPDRPADFPDLKSYSPVQYWPFVPKDTIQLEDWLRKDGLKKYPEFCLSTDHADYVLAIAMARGGPRQCGYTRHDLCFDLMAHSSAVLLYNGQNIAGSSDLSASTPEQFSMAVALHPPLASAKRLFTPMLKYLADTVVTGIAK